MAREPLRRAVHQDTLATGHSCTVTASRVLRQAGRGGVGPLGLRRVPGTSALGTPSTPSGGQRTSTTSCSPRHAGDGPWTHCHNLQCPQVGRPVRPTPERLHDAHDAIGPTPSTALAAASARADLVTSGTGDKHGSSAAAAAASSTSTPLGHQLQQHSSPGRLPVQVACAGDRLAVLPLPAVPSGRPAEGAWARWACAGSQGQRPSGHPQHSAVARGPLRRAVHQLTRATCWGSTVTANSALRQAGRGGVGPLGLRRVSGTSALGTPSTLIGGQRTSTTSCPPSLSGDVPWPHCHS